MMSFKIVKEISKNFESWLLQSETETKWPPFFRHFEIHIVQWKVWMLIKIAVEIVPNRLVNYKQALVQKMAPQRAGVKAIIWTGGGMLILPRWFKFVFVFFSAVVRDVIFALSTCQYTETKYTKYCVSQALLVIMFSLKRNCLILTSHKHL